MGALFITATGTEVGKTFVACGLIRRLRAGGRAVDALKPIASGFDPDRAASSDTGLLLSALGRPLSPREIARVSPWRFKAPLSPDMAARREGREIAFSEVVDYCRSAIAAQQGTLLIEGIGGIMVPLDHRHTVIDLIATLAIPLLLVTGSYLGAISHTLTALDAIDRRNLKVMALVINESAASTVPLEEVQETVSRFAPHIDVLVLPRFGAEELIQPVFHKLVAAL